MDNMYANASYGTELLEWLCRPEINVKPWNVLSKEIEESNKRKKWSEREPYAYWIGNPDLGRSRRELARCNVSETQDWKARIYKQVN